MEDKVYQLESASIGYEVGFEADILYCHLVRRLKETPLNQVKQVIIKKTSLGSGEEISFRIVYLENGNEKKFPWIQAKVTSSSTNEFLNDLKSRLSDQVIWEDRTQGNHKDEEGNNVYDLQYLPFGYGGAGLPRSVQIWIYLICLAILVIPLIYYIYLLATGGYRIYTNEQGLTIRKTSATTFAWGEIEKVNFTRINVIDRDNWSNTEVLKINIVGKNGRSKNGVMRYDHALPLLQELAEKGIICDDYLSNFN